MPAKTHLDVSLFTLGAASLLGRFSAIGLSPEAVLADAKAVSQRYGRKAHVKSRFPFTLTELLSDGAGERYTNLSITAMTIGGTDELFRLRGGSLDIRTLTDEVSGEADVWESEVATGTEYTVESNMRVDVDPAWMNAVLSGSSAALKVNVAIALGSLSAILPCKIGRANFAADVNKAQMEGVTLEGDGDPTSVSGNPQLVSILAGTGSFAYAAKLRGGGATIAGNALLKQTRLAFDNAAVQTAAHSFVNFGTPTSS